MGHSKLPWKLEGNSAIVTAYPVGDAEYESIADTYPVVAEGGNEKANANLIITAVNVMPEVKRILRCVVDEVINNPLRIQTFQDRCEHLLKKLEGIS